MSEMTLWGQPILGDPNPLRDIANVESLRSILPPEFFIDEMARLGTKSRLAVFAVAAGTLLSPVVDVIPGMSKKVSAHHDGTLGSVFIIGDSLTVGQKQQGLADSYGVAGIQVLGIEAKGGMQLYPYGGDIVEAHQPEIEIADAVIVQEGTNDPKKEVEPDALALARRINEIGVRNGTQPVILFQQLFGKMAEKGKIYETVVAQLQSEDIDARLLPRLQYMEQEGITSLITSDNVHLSPSGYRALNDLDVRLAVPIIMEKHNAAHPLPVVEAPIVEPTPVDVDPIVVLEPAITEPTKPLDATKLPMIFTIPSSETKKPSALDNQPLVFSIVPRITNAESKKRAENPVPAGVLFGIVARQNVDLGDGNQQPLSAITLPKLSELVSNEAPIQLSELPEPVFVSDQPQKPVDQALPVNVPSNEAIDKQAIIEKANMVGIFYDDAGQARTYLGSFVDPGQVPEIKVTEGFADLRDLGDGPYRQGNFDSSTNRQRTMLLAPAAGEVIIEKTSGEGNKVGIKLGTDPSTGNPYIWYATHLSEVDVKPGDFVVPSQLLGLSGDTGKTNGVVNSTGISGILTEDQFSEYANSHEAQNPFDFAPNVQYICGPDASSDSMELCGPTTPGEYSSLPASPAFLDWYGLPRTLTGAGPVDEAPTINNNAPLIFTISDDSSSANALPSLAEVITSEEPVLVPQVVIDDTPKKKDIIPAVDNDYVKFDLPSVDEVVQSTVPVVKPDIVNAVDRVVADISPDNGTAATPPDAVVPDPAVVAEEPVPVAPVDIVPEAAQNRQEILAAEPLFYIPEVWRGIFNSAAAVPENQEIDPRTVAAALWVENRHWPDPAKDWSVSSAKARGAMQILPQTWFGWNTDVNNWGSGGDNYLNNDLYSSSGVGRDGNGDGIKNPDDPTDSVFAAFQVMPGSMGDPIAFAGITGDPTVDINTLVFDKNSETQLARLANYNGDGKTPNGVTLEHLAQKRAQNADYIRMGAALLLTDLQYGIILDRSGPGYTWVDSQTLEPVSEDQVRLALGI